ncbi:uncharacterized protein LOC127881201 isoform X2 [Dreissena polymorpha]|uniref:uncharacterized protein LOC127881201 isoform X2 n=1 Tax=Dreissena polymorpha TaxID=45954 RepID=UPI0022643D79|nr:uncharacterized protein LOC127881201 isoform X2 [Dreissena polymorpha]
MLQLETRVVIATLVSVPVSSSGTPPRTPQCREPEVVVPNNGDDIYQLMADITFSGLPGWIGDAETLDRIPDQYKNRTLTHYFGNQNCHRLPASPRNSFRRHRNTLNELAVCGWSYFRNVDNNRRPRVLLDTVCSCIDPGIPDLICEPITRYVKVLRRVECQNGVYVYRNVFEPVHVGCVAVAIPPSVRAGDDGVRMAQ